MIKKIKHEILNPKQFSKLKCSKLKMFSFFDFYISQFVSDLGFRISDFRRGVVVIPTVLMLGGLIVTIALAVSLTTYLLNNSNYGVRLSIESLASAQAGLQDGILKIIKDNKFTTTALGYRFDPNTCVVVKTSPSNSPDVLQKEVIATSASFTRYHQLRSVVQINENTGELKVFSTEEIPISGYIKC